MDGFDGGSGIGMAESDLGSQAEIWGKSWRGDKIICRDLESDD